MRCSGQDHTKDEHGGREQYAGFTTDPIYGEPEHELTDDLADEE